MTQESWKTAYRSFYYEHAPIPQDLSLDPKSTALLIIDVQNTYLTESSDPIERVRWAPFMTRMHTQVIPNIKRLIETGRARAMNVLFARIACQTPDGRDRSLSQRKPGFNNLLLPRDVGADPILTGQFSIGVNTLYFLISLVLSRVKRRR